MILIAALLLAGYAFVQSRRQAAREADPYYGMVEVFNGDDYVWITPQDGVALNDLDKSEFINDASGNLTYTGREYKASRGLRQRRALCHRPRRRHVLRQRRAVYRR